MYNSEVYGRNGIYAKVVCDSMSPDNIRLITMELCYPRFIHSEFMTHRVFSRNASSSRAIPIAKMLKTIKETPAVPVEFGSNKPGMQAGDEVEDTELALAYWLEAAQNAVMSAEDMARVGVHKQITNRLIEPFQFIKVVVTATEWNNFYELRNHEAAQPEIHELARVMLEAESLSIPEPLAVNQIHAPYTTPQERMDLYAATLHMLSTARCARVSYLNHDKSDPDLDKDRALHDMLLEAVHMSPFEHSAHPMFGYSKDMHGRLESGVTHTDTKNNNWSGNFNGWIQYRQQL